MSSVPTFETEKTSIADMHARPNPTPIPALRPIDILTSLPRSSSSSTFSPPAPTPNHRPIDILALLRDRQTSSSALPPVQEPPCVGRRPVDIMADLKARSTLPSAPHPRPVDILATLVRPGPRPSSSLTPTSDPSSSQPEGLSPCIFPRPIAPLPKKAMQRSTSTHVPPRPFRQHFEVPKPHVHQVGSSIEASINAEGEDIIMDPPTNVGDSNFLDLTIESPKHQLPIIIELTDSSADESDLEPHPIHDPNSDINMRPVSFVFNTNLPVNPRNTVRPWVGSLQPEDWVPSREELHAEQVDFDRSLPSDMHHAGYPVYAISLSDMQSMHRFLMARYHISDFDDYKHLLALLRNTRAIAAKKARSRHADIRRLQDLVENARNHLVHQLRQGRSIS